MNPEVVTIGLGYIGLPTSALIASHGTNVLGVDINQSVVDTINQGKIHIVEPDLDVIVSKAVSNGFFKASTKPTSADVYLIVVPTPFKGNHEPDISFVEAATKGIIPLLKKGDLYIIESTSPIGTTDKMQKLIFASRPELEGFIHIAYCPERVLPGNVMHELVENDRIIGGVDEASAQKAISFYSKYVKGVLHATNARTAEMCKLVENSSRDNQIAFANELSIICDKADINVRELISLANKHPRVNILQPGCGVGGHCIAVDPYFLISNYKNEAKLIAKSREINDYKSLWVVSKVEEHIEKFKSDFDKNPRIGILGLAFKPNIDDLRESPALKICELLINNNQCEFYINEPNITKHKRFTLHDLEDVLKNSDIIVHLVNHDLYKNNNFKNKINLDFCGNII
jgi:UDP-N-acetyl-D-mannosaminuronic acid dehydrogenase